MAKHNPSSLYPNTGKHGPAVALELGKPKPSSDPWRGPSRPTPKPPAVNAGVKAKKLPAPAAKQSGRLHEGQQVNRAAAAKLYPSANRKDR